MTRTVMRILILGASTMGAASLALFVTAWHGEQLPDWALDLRWILLIVCDAIAIIVAIDQHIVSNSEAFRLGVKVGESPSDRHFTIGTSQNSNTGPQPMRGHN